MKGKMGRPAGAVTACPHVDRKHYARGLCAPCYNARPDRTRPAPRGPRRGRAPACGHPDRPHHAKGLCLPCYNARPDKPPRGPRKPPPPRAPTCGHPDRRHYSGGLCKPCYARKRRASAPKRGRRGPVAAPVTCGHATAPHYAHGLCRRCYEITRVTLAGGTPRGPRPRWTIDDDRALAIAWARGGAPAAAEATGRTLVAVEVRARDLRLPSPARAVGCVTVQEFCRATGYLHATVCRAIRRLGLVPVQAAPRTASAVQRDRQKRPVAMLAPADQHRLLAHLAIPGRKAPTPGGHRLPAPAPFDADAIEPSPVPEAIARRLLRGDGTNTRSGLAAGVAEAFAEAAYTGQAGGSDRWAHRRAASGEFLGDGYQLGARSRIRSDPTLLRFT